MNDNTKVVKFGQGYLAGYYTVPRDSERDPGPYQVYRGRHYVHLHLDELTPDEKRDFARRGQLRFEDMTHQQLMARQRKILQELREEKVQRTRFSVPRAVRRAGSFPHPLRQSREAVTVSRPTTERSDTRSKTPDGGDDGGGSGGCDGDNSGDPDPSDTVAASRAAVVDCIRRLTGVRFFRFKKAFWLCLLEGRRPA